MHFVAAPVLDNLHANGLGDPLCLGFVPRFYILFRGHLDSCVVRSAHGDVTADVSNRNVGVCRNRLWGHIQVVFVIVAGGLDDSTEPLLGIFDANDDSHECEHPDHQEHFAAGDSAAGSAKAPPHGPFIQLDQPPENNEQRPPAREKPC